MNLLGACKNKIYNMTKILYLHPPSKFKIYNMTLLYWLCNILFVFRCIDGTHGWLLSPGTTPWWRMDQSGINYGVRRCITRNSIKFLKFFKIKKSNFHKMNRYYREIMHHHYSCTCITNMATPYHITNTLGGHEN